MKPSKTRSGGVFLALGILAGLAWGATSGQAFTGVLVGASVGLAVLVLLWIADLRRS